MELLKTAMHHWLQQVVLVTDYSPNTQGVLEAVRQLVMWRRVLSFPKRRPVVFGCAFSCAKTAFADFLVQRYVEDTPISEIDTRRMTVFGLFGLTYLGAWQYFLYVKCFPRWFPAAAPFAAKSFRAKLSDNVGKITVLKQVAVDQFVHHPVLYFPCFYLLKEMLESGDPTRAWPKLRDNFTTDVVELWKVWIPAFIVNFSFCPMWGRVPFVACVSLGWTMLFSYMRGRPEDDK